MDLNQNDDWVGIFERKQIREMDGPAWNWEQKPAVPNAINTRQRRAETQLINIIVVVKIITTTSPTRKDGLKFRTRTTPRIKRAVYS